MATRQFRIVSKRAEESTDWLPEADLTRHAELRPIAGFLRRIVPRARLNFTCPACGYAESQFRETGLLGCGLCYSVFEVDIQTLLFKEAESETP